jgi:hypothetical protein
MARHLTLFAFIFGLAATGCSSCDDETGGNTGSNANSGTLDAGANDGGTGGGDAGPAEDFGMSGDDGGTANDSGMGGADAEVDMGAMCPTSRECDGTCCAVGDVCVLGQCLPPCPSGVRCGADLATCCDGGDVCINATCTMPGATCLDSFDCEPGEYC